MPRQEQSQQLGPAAKVRKMTSCRWRSKEGTRGHAGHNACRNRMRASFGSSNFRGGAANRGIDVEADSCIKYEQSFRNYDNERVKNEFPLARLGKINRSTRSRRSFFGVDILIIEDPPRARRLGSLPRTDRVTR